MVVSTDLDVTPPATFTTIQSSSDIANALLTALLTVFIISNIVSVVSKLIYSSHQTSFSYPAFLRAFIFANSDDPLRILSWLAHNYSYPHRPSARYRNVLVPSRLILPLLARTLIFAIAITSIAIAIPGEKRLSGCAPGDHRLVLASPPIANPVSFANRVCVDIPLVSRLGTVRSFASYCACRVTTDLERDNDFNPDVQLAGMGAIASSFTKTGLASSLLFSRGSGATYIFYVVWRPAPGDNSFPPLFSDADKLNASTHIQVMADALRRITGEPCRILTEDADRDDDITLRLAIVDCDFDPEHVVEEVQAYVTAALTWERLPPGQVDPRREGTSLTGTCPVEVVVTRPIVNVLPLGLALILLVLLNILVSKYTSTKSNAFDAGFHLVKEALGHDTTSNPLEENASRKEVMTLPLRKWRCGPGGAHIGFIGREGDIPMTEFDASTNVCGCTQVITEIEQAGARREMPSPAGVPDPPPQVHSQFVGDHSGTFAQQGVSTPSVDGLSVPGTANAGSDAQPLRPQQHAFTVPAPSAVSSQSLPASNGSRQGSHVSGAPQE